MTFAVKVLILTNVALFFLTWFMPAVGGDLGLRPENVFGHYWVWQPITYMFIHAGIGHILWNMLVLWMFGVELERLWGTKFFVKFYLAAGLAGALVTILVSLLPNPSLERLYYTLTVGSSGAILGLLLAYAMYFPDRPIYMYFLFAIPAKYFVLIIGLISVVFASANTSWTAHLGGLAGGYLFLKFGRARPLAELQYRYFKWKMNRLRRRFDVHRGGKAKDWDRRIH